LAPDDEPKARAARALDVPAYFGLNSRETFFYRVLCLVYHRQDDKYARAVVKELEKYGNGPLSDFARGQLLGIIDGLYWSKAISEHMHVLLQTTIQARKN
jgi:hypothetical protein